MSDDDRDIRDIIRAWAAEYLGDTERWDESFASPPNHLTKRELAAALLEHLPGSDGALTPGAIAAEEKRSADAMAAWRAHRNDTAAREAEAAAWLAANPGGTRERPICVEAVRRLCLARTDANEWCVVEHGGWTEDPGHAIGSFTMGYVDGADWYASEAEARAAFAIASGQVDHEKLVKLAAEHADEIARDR